MRISELLEQESRWQAFRRGFGQELARRYVPDIDFQKKPAAKALATASATVPTAGTATTVRPQPPVNTPTPVVPTSTAPATLAPATSVPTALTPQPAANKPRVLAQPIRVGNKIYRPGDVMHARLSQMMQAQQRS